MSSAKSRSVRTFRVRPKLFSCSAFHQIGSQALLPFLLSPLSVRSQGRLQASKEITQMPKSGEVEETLKRIGSHKGVHGIIVVNSEGIPIRTTLDNSTTVHYAGQIHQVTQKAQSCVRDLDPQNELSFLRLRSKKNEIMVAPAKEYLLIVIQNPSD